MEEHVRRLQAARPRPSHAIGSRSMPQWVSRTFVHPSAVPPPPPPPPSAEVGGTTHPRENDYEEIGPTRRPLTSPQQQQQQQRQQLQQQQQLLQQQQQRQQQIMNLNSRQLSRSGLGDGRESRIHCDLCGSSASAVRCDKCGSQVFCLSCDDMYHRHPKRSSHVRKAVDSMQRPFRPPLPPKSELQMPPVPPPRRNKRFGLFGKKDQQSPALPRKENASGVMGSLKRFMGVRPLPPPPSQKGGLTSVWEEATGPPPDHGQHGSLSRGGGDQARLPGDDTSAALSATLADINAADRRARQPSVSRSEMLQERGEEGARPRSQSVSGHTLPSQLQQPPWMYPAEPQQHQSDMLQGFVTTRRGQSYHRASAGGWPQMMSTGSVCDVTSPPLQPHQHHHHHMHPGFMPHMMHAQSMAQLGCPTCHGAAGMWYPAEQADPALVRYPSNTSLTGGYPIGIAVGGGGGGGGTFTSSRDLRHASPAASGRSSGGGGRTTARARRLARSQMELSRYTSETDELASGAETDDESDRLDDPPAGAGRAPTPTVSWHCQHCTFQNSPGSRVCAMCCRTQPIMPPPAAQQHHQQQQPQQQQQQQQQSQQQQQQQQKKRRRRRFIRGQMPPGSPVPSTLGRPTRDPSPGSGSRGRDPSPGGVSRGREPSPADLTDSMRGLKMPAAGQDRGSSGNVFVWHPGPYVWSCGQPQVPYC